MWTVIPYQKKTEIYKRKPPLRIKMKVKIITFLSSTNFVIFYKPDPLSFSENIKIFFT